MGSHFWVRSAYFCEQPRNYVLRLILTNSLSKIVLFLYFRNSSELNSLDISFHLFHLALVKISIRCLYIIQAIMRLWYLLSTIVNLQKLSIAKNSRSCYFKRSELKTCSIWYFVIFFLQFEVTLCLWRYAKKYVLIMYFCIMHLAPPKAVHRQRRWTDEAGLGAFFFSSSKFRFEAGYKRVAKRLLPILSILHI